MKKRKGIILAGGSGTRLHPVTRAISKQLLPIYDKPMIYYPMSVLMLSGIKDILIITTPRDIEAFKTLLKDGSQFGINLSYAVQEQPHGVAHAFILGEEFIASDNVTLILGDNIFYGQHFSERLNKVNEKTYGATIFGYHVNDPSRFGIVDFKDNEIKSIHEKPSNPKSNYAVTGLYYYDNDVIEIAKGIKKSSRGELEITSVNNEYLKEDKLSLEILGRGFTWLDSGTHDSLLEASQFIKAIEKQQGFKVACLEEIALNNGWITTDLLIQNIYHYENTIYGEYLKKIAIDYENS